jgi:hypothetical protein
MESVFNRIVAIIENGTYEGESLGAKALRTFPDSLDTIPKPCVLILPRGDSSWAWGSGASWYNTNLSYDLYFYIREAKTGADAVGLADADNLNLLATKIFLSRPQLQLVSYDDIPEIAGQITWQTTSSLGVPILYPSSGVSSSQGAVSYWGFIARLVIPYRLYITMSPQG